MQNLLGFAMTESVFQFKVAADTAALTRLQNELKLSERIAAGVGKAIAAEISKGMDGAASEIRGKRSSLQSALEGAFDATIRPKVRMNLAKSRG